MIRGQERGSRVLKENSNMKENSKIIKSMDKVI